MRFKTMGVVGALVISTAGTSVLVAQRAPFRVCADPDYLPFSNRAGEGFENKIAASVAKALGQPLEYVWANSRGRGGFPEFLSLTLDATNARCDWPRTVIAKTDHAAITSLVCLRLQEEPERIRSMDSPVLQKRKIGLEGETPVEDGAKIRGMLPRATVFDVGSTSGESPSTMLDALDKGAIDVLITWEPAIGRFLGRYRDLDVVAVPNARTLGAPEQYVFPISMGVRQGDEAMQKRLDQVILDHQSELTAILTQYGVKLYT